MMLAKGFLMIVCVSLVVLLGATACTPDVESEASGIPSNQEQSKSGNDSAPAENSGIEGGIPETIVVYADESYQFGVSYPTDFVLRAQSADKLTQLQPVPVAAVTIMNPVTAASDLADLEPADLEIRIYAAASGTALETWLTSAGLLPADGSVQSKPFQTDKVSGVQVCSSTMIVPGCTYFFLGNDWIYQLIPVSLEGEAMMNTFSLLTTQSQGAVKPGASAGDSPAAGNSGAGEGQPGMEVVYADESYQFGVSYPTDFVLRAQSADKLTQLQPVPVAAVTIMNPVTAASDLADLEPADLEIRIYAAASGTALETWLTSAGLLPADGSVQSKPFQAGRVSGIRVCFSTMIVPGCTYFFLGDDWIYQLIPVTLEGEAMMNTFSPLP